MRRIRTIVCAVACAVAVGSFGTWKRFERTSRSAAAVRPEAPKKQPRTVYKYSVIPGGAYSAEELARSRRIDRVVAAHYADFGASDIAVRRLSRDSYFYVSYRKADRVYWTAKKHRIPKGECVLTDGKSLARARCGNRLSLNPQMPLLDIEKAPTEAALNSPEPPEGIDFPAPPLYLPEFDAPAPAGTDAEAVSGASPAAGKPGAPNGEWGPLSYAGPYFFAPVGGLGLIGGGGPNVPGGGGGEILPVLVGETPVPEPQVLALMLAGTGLILCLFSRRRFRKKAIS